MTVLWRPLTVEGHGKRTGNVHPRAVAEDSSTLSLISALEGVAGQRHAPAALPLGKTRYPLCKSLGGPQGRSGQVRKISLPPGFNPRTVQPVASRYTDWAIPPNIDWQDGD